MNHDAYVPMPDTCHPRFEDQAGTIRAYLEQPGPIMVPSRTLPPSYYMSTEPPATSIAMRPVRLDIRKYGGPAPYVGRAFAYRWRVAIDSIGRHVAGPAELVYTEEWSSYEMRAERLLHDLRRKS